jgi:hypothetical protein
VLSALGEKNLRCKRITGERGCFPGQSQGRSFGRGVRLLGETLAACTVAVGRKEFQAVSTTQPKAISQAKARLGKK